VRRHRVTLDRFRKRKGGRTGDDGAYIKPLLIQAAWAAVRVPGRLQARFRRLVRKFGGPKNNGAQKRAITAIAHTPAQDRLQRPEHRHAIHRPGHRLLHPQRIPRRQAGLPDAAAAQTQPRLRHHHHARGGRLTAETT
jgi:hypothetical protein